MICTSVKGYNVYAESDVQVASLSCVWSLIRSDGSAHGGEGPGEGVCQRILHRGYVDADKESICVLCWMVV